MKLSSPSAFEVARACEVTRARREQRAEAGGACRHVQQCLRGGGGGEEGIRDRYGTCYIATRETLVGGCVSQGNVAEGQRGGGREEGWRGGWMEGEGEGEGEGKGRGRERRGGGGGGAKDPQFKGLGLAITAPISV